MNETEINNRFEEINAKLDMVLQYVENQSKRFKAVEDLVDDTKIIGYDLFNTTVEELDHNNIEIDPLEVKMLLLRLVKNLGNLNDMMGQFESINDLLKDLGPITHDLGLSTIETIALYEEKGYFKIFENLSGNIESILKIAVNFSNPDLLNTLEVVSRKISESKIDTKKYNKSLFGLYKELKSPEVRQTLAFSLRMIKELNIELNKQNNN
ncbi:MAG: hypothetical protein C0596_04925 [Marinilabiliales bacterium]|nr:MAG: hypothetical protein C0596_04925 [Marinilabiliales bacterium]